MKSRPSAWHIGPRGTAFMTVSFIATILQVSFSGAFSSKRARLYFLTFMREYVDIMLHQGDGQKGFTVRFFQANGRQWRDSDREVL
jgi:hypothetical protein